MSRLEGNDFDYRPSLAASDDMVIAYALMELVEIKNSGASLSKDALNNLNAIILIAKSMRGELQ